MSQTLSSPDRTSPQKWRTIGLMSGSSLDGLDMACCDFWQENNVWRFNIVAGACAAYTDAWVDRLRTARTASAQDLWQLHADFGRFCGEAVSAFVREHDVHDVLCVASHGHTIFHFPQQRFTTQIGCGAALAAFANLPVVCDFRSADVAKGGQGAPLVPVGDQLLFGDHKFLLNLGGIANLTIKYHDRIVAFDICCANQILNHYAQRAGRAFDPDGQMAARGRIHDETLAKLDALAYYAEPYPKSLDNGYSQEVIIPLLDEAALSVDDTLCTMCEHIARQISHYIKVTDVTVQDSLLVTGGGALNHYLLSRIAHHVPVAVLEADTLLVQYKEALVFALLGLLRWQNQTNVRASVTGASRDSVAGAVYLP